MLTRPIWLINQLWSIWRIIQALEDPGTQRWISLNSEDKTEVDSQMRQISSWHCKLSLNHYRIHIWTACQIKWSTRTRSRLCGRKVMTNCQRPPSTTWMYLLATGEMLYRRRRLIIRRGNIGIKPMLESHWAWIQLSTRNGQPPAWIILGGHRRWRIRWVHSCTKALAIDKGSKTSQWLTTNSIWFKNLTSV